jgi:uncharacterized protein YqfB (UPF0267 family)
MKFLTKVIEDVRIGNGHKKTVKIRRDGKTRLSSQDIMAIYNHVDDTYGDDNKIMIRAMGRDKLYTFKATEQNFIWKPQRNIMRDV